MKTAINRRAAIFGLILAMAPMAGALPAAAQQSKGGISYGGPFILVDQNGATVMDDAFRGKFMLLAFGYTHCPDICPTLLADMASAMKLLGADASSVQPLFITLDPARDTPKVLADYVGSFSPRLIGLTGPEALVESVARKYHIKFEKHEEKDGAYSIDHTAAVFLMDREGKFLDRFNSGATPEEITKRIQERLKAEGK